MTRVLNATAAAADDDLAGTELSRPPFTAAHAGHQYLMNFAEQPQAHWQPLQSLQTKLQRPNVIVYFLSVIAVSCQAVKLVLVKLGNGRGCALNAA